MTRDVCGENCRVVLTYPRPDRGTLSVVRLALGAVVYRYFHIFSDVTLSTPPPRSEIFIVMSSTDWQTNTRIGGRLCRESQLWLTVACIAFFIT